MTNFGVHLKNNFMKSTLKVTYERLHNGSIPVLQIVQPLDLYRDQIGNAEDPKDDLLTDFLHSPLMSEPNWLFDRSSYFTTEAHKIVSIKSVAVEDEMPIAIAILKKQLEMEQRNEYSTPEKCVNRINESFKQIEDLKIELLSHYVKTTIQKAPEVPQGKHHETVRDFYELILPPEARIFAFENTAKSKLDRKACNLYDAVLSSFYIADTPQGANYWQDVILECLN